MKTRVLIELEIETTEKDQHPELYVAQILDWGDLQDLIEDRDEGLGKAKVTSAMISTLEDDLKEILWPGGDPDHEWSSETIEDVARRVEYLRPREDVESAIDKIMRAERQAEIQGRESDVEPTVSGMDYRPYTVVGYLNSWNVAVGLELPQPFVEHIEAASPAHAVDLVKQVHRDDGRDTSQIVEVFEGTHEGKIKS
jgi:hypothetical protein